MQLNVKEMYDRHNPRYRKVVNYKIVRKPGKYFTVNHRILLPW